MWPIITREHRNAADRVLSSGVLTDGPEVEAFERRFAERVGANYAVMTSSGTAALHAGLLAGSIDEVAVPSYSFSGSALGAVQSGIAIRWQDIDPASGHVTDWSEATAAMPVHIHGNAAPVPDGFEFVIEDCAQAFGTLDETGRQVGYQGDCAAWSLNATKVMWAGEGGVLTTDNRDLADEVRRIVHFGGTARNTWRIGYNWKGDEMRAALGSASLDHVDKWIENGQEAGAILDDAVAECPLLSPMEIVGTPNRHKYRLRFDSALDESAEAVVAKMNLVGIPATTWQTIPLPLMNGLRQPALHAPSRVAPGNHYDNAWALLNSSVIIGEESKPLAAWDTFDAVAVADALASEFS